MKIEKELHLAAPYAGAAVYVMGQCYTDSAGLEIVDSVTYQAINQDYLLHGGPPPYAYAKELYRRISSDNGKTWRQLGSVYRDDPLARDEEHKCAPLHFRDPDNGLLLSLQLAQKWDVAKKTETFSDENLGLKRRMYYEISRDKGRTWEGPRILVHEGDAYDEIHWGPGLHYGRNGAGVDLGGAFKLPDHTIICPLHGDLEDGKRYQSALLRGRWKPDLSDIEWEFSDYITVPLDKSSQGCCEPMPVPLDDGRIFVSLRCCGDRVNKTFPSLKYWVMSDDGGKTFSEPQPLTYEDGSMVWSPSSYAGILRSSVNKRYYWIGNILDKPTFSAYPRYPLCIAQLMPERGTLVRDSVAVIDTKPDDFPDERRRYTNFGFYEDRVTREIVLTLPEEPKNARPRKTPKDKTSDCYRYRIRVGG